MVHFQHLHICVAIFPAIFDISTIQLQHFYQKAIWFTNACFRVDFRPLCNHIKPSLALFYDLIIVYFDRHLKYFKMLNDAKVALAV